MFERLKYWMLKLFGIKVSDKVSNMSEHDEERYEDTTDMKGNFTAIIANRLGNLVFGDSSMQVKMENGGDMSARVQMIGEVLERLFCDDGQRTTAHVFGKGGIVLVPYVAGGNVYVQSIAQSRMIVTRKSGRRIDAVTLILDSTVKNDKKYFLLADYDLQGTDLTIRYRVINENDGTAGIGYIAQWADVPEMISISNVRKLPIAFVKCPRDSRRDDNTYGVPITYGCESVLEELEEHIGIYRREFKLTRPMLGLDSTLFRSREGAMQTNTIESIRKTVQDGDDPFIPFDAPSMDAKSMWQLYAPNIRQQQMEERYQSLLRRLERSCGLSQGILTERSMSMSYTNKDEVRAAQYDTFTVITAMRDAWEHAMEDLAEAIDVLAERFHLTPAGSRGQYAIEYDWDLSMIESSQQTYQQLSELQAGGMVSRAELRAWVMSQSVEDAQAAIDAIAENGETESEIGRMLGAMMEPQEE